VGAYLGEFLMDPLVIDLPFPLRWLLVHGIIVPRRRNFSAGLYRKIWTDAGSPLLLNSQELGRRLAEKLGPLYRVKLAMRYGSPSLAAAFSELRQEGVRDILVSPQYPQYALPSYESTRRQAEREAREKHPTARLRFLPPFFQQPPFLAAYAALLVDFGRTHQPDHYLFSFHGLPVRHLKKTDRSGDHCYRSPNCCAALEEANRDCYRAQCFWTARALARDAGIPEGRFTVGFQSRLGRSRWIEPHSDELLARLAAGGVRRLGVACPSFTADCLETLEEVGIRYRREFRRLGGDELHLVPSLNAHPRWVQALGDLIARETALVSESAEMAATVEPDARLSSRS